VTPPALLEVAVDWIDRHSPHDPRVLRLLDKLVPALVTAVLILNIVQIGRVGDVSNEAQTLSQRTLILSRQNHRFAAELRAGLIENCEKNGNPLREVLIEEQEAAILGPHDPRIHELLPGTPQAVINQIVAEGNREHRERKAKLTPVDCPKLYPSQRSVSGSRR
jgi:hypothetical protein